MTESAHKLAIMPQNTRLMAFFLGSVGGCLDVFSHMQFGTLIATQTGNILLLIADWGEKNLTKTLDSILSLVFFTIGFILAILFKERAKNAHWRSVGILPLFISSFLYPFFSEYKLIWIPLLAASTGMMMLTFTGSKIEEHDYVIMMTSGNYRKMVTAWFDFLRFKDRRPLIKRQAINYSIVVGSFVGGAIITGILTHIFQTYAIWCVTAVLFAIILVYTTLVKAYDLEEEVL
ncbi:YoaK family protein [Streptococcus dentapri]|uniref:YoaK family protein n=1 Tax=Streptococcus dentapri TaxID=573564 RepID=A0ABV8D0C6_9STRE